MKKTVLLMVMLFGFGVFMVGCKQEPAYPRNSQELNERLESKFGNIIVQITQCKCSAVNNTDTEYDFQLRQDNQKEYTLIAVNKFGDVVIYDIDHRNKKNMVTYSHTATEGSYDFVFRGIHPETLHRHFSGCWEILMKKFTKGDPNYEYFQKYY